MKLKPQKIGKAGQLAMLMSMPALDGNIVLLVLGGLFSLQNVMLIGLTVMSGPGAFIQSATLDATTKERILLSVVAGLIATAAVILSATLGPKLFELIDINIMKFAGGIAVCLIGLMIAGVKLPSMIPLVIVLTGLILAFVSKTY